MRPTPLLLMLLFNTACHTAVIPLPDNDELDSLGNDLRSEAAAFLDEDVFHHMNSPQTTPNPGDQHELPHPDIDDIGNKIVYEGKVYSVDEDGRFVLDASMATSATLDAPDKKVDSQNTPVSLEDSTFDGAPDNMSDATSATVVTVGNLVDDVYPEDGDHLGEDEFILDQDDEDDEDEDIDEEEDNEDLETDSESGMPVFRNKHEDDFNFDTLDIMADDERSGHMTNPSPSSSIYRFNFSDWRFLLGAGLVLIVLKLAAIQSGHSTPSFTESTTTYIERRKHMSHKYEQAAARRLPIHTQDLSRKSIREHPPPSFVFPTILEEDDEDEERHINKYSRRASAGHIRRPPASGNGRAPSSNHIRHASLGGKFPL